MPDERSPGGVTAPLMLLGLRHARDPLDRGVPVVIRKGHDLLRRFTERHGTVLCREIRGSHRLPLPCVTVVRHAPEMLAHTFRGCTLRSVLGLEDNRKAFRRYKAMRHRERTYL